jgi:hypothetical protein
MPFISCFNLIFTLFSLPFISVCSITFHLYTFASQIIFRHVLWTLLEFVECFFSWGVLYHVDSSPPRWDVLCDIYRHTEWLPKPWEVARTDKYCCPLMCTSAVISLYKYATCSWNIRNVVLRTHTLLAYFQKMKGFIKSLVSVCVYVYVCVCVCARVCLSTCLSECPSLT